MESEKSNQELLIEIVALRHELNDLKLIMEAVTGHSDGIESELLQKINASEELFLVISQAIPVPFIITGYADKIFFSNKHANKLFGYPAELFLNQLTTDLFKNPESLQLFFDILSEQGRIDNFELEAQKADGSSFWVCLFSQPIIYKQQDCILTVIYDLTERIKAEEEKIALEKKLRQTQKMEAIGRLASGIAHDFNNILTIIFGNMELAKISIPSNSRTQHYIDKTLYAAHRAKEMVGQILDFCRQREHEYLPFILDQVISKAAEMIKNLTPANIEVKLKLKSKGHKIKGDPTQINQVLMNLVANAVYAMQDKGGVIEITLEPIQISAQDQITVSFPINPGTYIKLTVSDNGPGIDNRIISRIFDPFFTTKPTGEGTGLGLAVVHGIIQRHGGAVMVDSFPSKGAAFYCYFPLYTEQNKAELQKVVEEPVLTLTGNNQRILLIDDEQDILELLAEILQQSGYETIGCLDALQALTVFEQSHHIFDLVITDNVMPKMTGKELSAKILAIRPDIPIIISTGLSDQLDQQELMNIGVKGLIAKPFVSHQICRLIRKVLEQEII